MRTIGDVCRDLIQSCSFDRSYLKSMSNHHSEIYASSGFGGLSRGLSWRERRHKRNKDRRYEWGEEHSGSRKGSSQTYQLASKVFKQRHLDRLGQDLECLRRLFRNLELEVRGRHQRRIRGEFLEGFVSVGGSCGEASHQSGSCRSRERSWDFVDRDSISPERHIHRSAAMDAIGSAFQSPFLDDIEHAPMPWRFSRPPFISYDKKTDPIKHVSYYIQMMSLYNQNDALMCKVFPSNLGPSALRWFNGLRKGSIHSFGELIQEFDAQFMTCS